MDKEWYAKKYFGVQKYSDAWGIAKKLYSWCARNIGRGIMTYGRNSMDSLLRDYKKGIIKKGAPAFLWNESLKRYNHAILIGKATKNNVFYWAHTLSRNGNNTKSNAGIKQALKGLYSLISIVRI